MPCTGSRTPVVARKQDLFVFAAQSGDHPFEPRLGDGHHLHPDEARLSVSVCRAGLCQPPSAVVATVQHADDRLLYRGGAGGDQPLRPAGNLQHRPGLSVHQPGIHRLVEGQRHPDQYGRQGVLARQRVRGTAMAQRKIRGGLSACLRHGERCQGWLASILRTL